MVCSESETEEVLTNKRGFSSKVARIESLGGTLQQQNEEEFNNNEENHYIQPETTGDQQFALMKLEEIMTELDLSETNDIIPYLVKLKTNLKEFSLVDTIARSLQVFFYNIGKGKLTKKEMVPALEDLEISYNRNLEAVDTLDEICIEAGAKRDKLK